MKQVWAAPERNKDPILAVLQDVLPKRGCVLELASGSGQHAVHFATHLPALSFQPSDSDPENLESIRAWVTESALENLLPPLTLDVRDAQWPVDKVDAIFCANMVHISEWACSIALLEGAARHLDARGVLVIYGPFRLNGEHTAPSNAAFDDSLKARNPAWGVRDAEAIEALAAPHGFVHCQRIAMPANNQCLVLRRATP